MGQNAALRPDADVALGLGVALGIKYDLWGLSARM